METPARCYKCLRRLEPPVHYGLHEACFVEWFRLPYSMDFQELNPQSAADSGTQSSEFRSDSFFHGKFKKYSATLNGLSYILKFKTDAYPELTTVEYLCNRIARTLKIPTPDFYLVEVGGEPVFVTKNFVDRKYSNLEHIYKYIKTPDYHCERICELILAETGARRDVRTFVRTCLFDALVGNHDRHGRNLAFVVTPAGKSLAPIYDNPSALGLESGPLLESHFSPRGKIFTARSEEPTAKDYVAEFVRMGYADEVRAFARSVNPGEINALIEESFCSAGMKRALRKLIVERCGEMQSEMKSEAERAV